MQTYVTAFTRGSTLSDRRRTIGKGAVVPNTDSRSRRNMVDIIGRDSSKSEI